MWNDQGMLGFISKDDLEEVLEMIDDESFAKITLGDIYGGTDKKPTLGCYIVANYN